MDVIHQMYLWLLNAEESNTMNPSTGNLVKREINTLGMQQVKYMRSPKIWPLIFQ